MRKTMTFWLLILIMLTVTGCTEKNSLVEGTYVSNDSAVNYSI